MRIAPPALFACLVAAACPGRGPSTSTPPEPPPLACDACDLTQPLNAVLAPEFVRLGLTPRLAPREELCRRVGFDLLGRPLSTAEDAACVDAASFDDALLALQGSDDYLLQSQRHWADRFVTDDVFVDFRATVALYDQVDALHRGELRYSDFVVDALRQPGLINADFTAAEHATRIVSAFFLRKPNVAEIDGLAPLWRAWLVDFDPANDFEIPIPRNRGYVLPGLCEPLASCRTTLWGGAAVDFSFVSADAAFVPVYADEFDDEMREALAAPGRLLAAQPETYEAEADALLDRFLDWDEGERDIRTPGHLFPEVRAVLAAHLRDDGDVPAAERLVLTSLLYLQTADVDADGVVVDGDEAERPHPLSVGPSKPITGEAWLRTLQNTTSYDYGSCDPRFPDGFSYAVLYDVYSQGLLTGAAFNEAMEALHAARRDRGRLQPGDEVAADGTVLLTYDYGFYFVARQVGGCPGFGAPRRRPVGVAFASVQDAMAELLCIPDLLDRVVPAGRPGVSEIVDSMTRALLQRPATADEIDAVVAGSGCNSVDDDGDCSAGALASRLCVGLAGTSEMMFR
jgi:hypothetical protein